MRLKDKVAIVTGASRGIGRAIALGMAHEGAKVVVNFCNNKKSADEVVKRICQNGGTAMAIKADISNSREVQKMVNKTLEVYSSIDILVNNAAFLPFRKFFDITEDIWDRVLDVNLKGYFLCSQAVARIMVERKIRGKIICISSISSIVGGEEQVHYCASKGGINLLTKSMAISLGQYGINCNAILPGVVQTDINREDFKNDPEKEKYFIKHIPLKRLGKPEDIVGTAIFLSTSDSDWITGSMLVVDGGYIVCL